MDPETFMKEASRDADQRAADRKIREEKAETFKTRATKAFRRGDYELALTCYNNAIEQVRTSCLLYTNRALTFIKLEKLDKVKTKIINWLCEYIKLFRDFWFRLLVWLQDERLLDILSQLLQITATIVLEKALNSTSASFILKSILPYIVQVILKVAMIFLKKIMDGNSEQEMSRCIDD